MFNRIKTLMLLQLSDRFKIKKVDNVPKFLAKIGLALLGIILVTGVCSVLLLLLHSNTHLTTPKVISVLISCFQILSIIACTNGLLKTLYTSKDNPILLSYPAHHVEVFLSKLLVYYVYEFIKSIFFILPMILGFGIVYGYIDILYVVNTLLLVIILPLFPVLLGALITIPFLYLKKLIDKYPVLKTILLILALVGLYVLLVVIVYNIPRPLQILEMFFTFREELTGIVEGIDKFSLYYHNIGNILTEKDILFDYLLVVGVLVGLIISVALISMPLYFKLASRSSEQATEKERSGVNKAHKSSFITFIKKEWLLTIRNFGEFLNNYIFIFATPYVLFVMMGVYTSMRINSLGVYLIVAFSGFIALMMSCASNTSSALAITKEGSEFVLLKTVPANSSNMVWAKLFYNLIFSTFMIALGYVLVILILPLFSNTIYNTETEMLWEWQIENNMLWWMMLASILVNAAMILWSLQIDIMNPKLREYASSGDTSGMNNASKSILIGVIVAVVFTAIVAITLVVLGNVDLTWIIIISVAALFLLARLYLFISHLKYVFPYIEY